MSALGFLQRTNAELDAMDSIIDELFPQAECDRKAMPDASLRQYVHPEDVIKGERERDI